MAFRRLSRSRILVLVTGVCRYLAVRDVRTIFCGSLPFFRVISSLFPFPCEGRETLGGPAKKSVLSVQDQFPGIGQLLCCAQIYFLAGLQSLSQGNGICSCMRRVHLLNDLIRIYKKCRGHLFQDREVHLPDCFQFLIGPVPGQ